MGLSPSPGAAIGSAGRRRTDRHRPGDGHGRLHGPRAGLGQPGGRYPGRHLQPGATLYKLLSGRAPFGGPEHQGTSIRCSPIARSRSRRSASSARRFPTGWRPCWIGCWPSRRRSVTHASRSGRGVIAVVCRRGFAGVVAACGGVASSPLPPGEGGRAARLRPLSLPGEGQGEGKSLPPQPLVSSAALAVDDCGVSPSSAGRRLRSGSGDRHRHCTRDGQKRLSESPRAVVQTSAPMVGST